MNAYRAPVLVLCLLAFAGLAVADAGLWFPRAPMPVPVYSPGAAAVFNSLYVFGGTNDSGQVSAGTQVYNAGTDSWGAGADMPSARYGTAAAAGFDAQIYVAGGFTEVAGIQSADLNIYDTSTNTWSSGAAMPAPRAFVGGAASFSEIYFAGGVIGNNATAEFLAYDPEGNSWAMRAPLSSARYLVATVGLNGNIFAVGGALQGGSPVATVEFYQPEFDQWTTLAPLPAARAGAGIVAYNNKLYVFGGTDEVGMPMTDVYCYDPEINVWTVEAAMPESHLYGAYGVVGDDIVASGGTDQLQETSGSTSVLLIPAVSLSWSAPPPPNGDDMMAGPDTIDVSQGPVTVTFTATASNTDGGTLRFTFAFGDAEDSVQTVTQSGTAAIVTHDYAYAGEYRPYVTVTEAGGTLGAVSRRVNLSAINSVLVSSTATAHLSYTLPNGAVAPVDVAFDTSGSTGDHYEIDFGDGFVSSGNGLPPSAIMHHYFAPGAYEVSLTMLDGAGAPASQSQMLYLHAEQELTAELLLSTSGGTSPLLVMFDGCHSVPANDGTHLASFEMDFGDGSPTVTKVVDATHVVDCSAADRSNDPSLFSHVYTVSSTQRFVPILTVTDDASTPRTAIAKAAKISVDAPVRRGGGGGALGLLTLMPLAGAVALRRRRRF